MIRRNGLRLAIIATQIPICFEAVESDGWWAVAGWVILVAYIILTAAIVWLSLADYRVKARLTADQGRVGETGE